MPDTPCLSKYMRSLAGAQGKPTLIIAAVYVLITCNTKRGQGVLGQLSSAHCQISGLEWDSGQSFRITQAISRCAAVDYYLGGRRTYTLCLAHSLLNFQSGKLATRKIHPKARPTPCGVWEERIYDHFYISTALETLRPRNDMLGLSYCFDRHADSRDNGPLADFVSYNGRHDRYFIASYVLLTVP